MVDTRSIPTTPSAMTQHRFAVMAKRENGGPCSLHTLRHSFATHLLYKDCDLYTISQLLGHTSTETITIYLHLFPARYVQLKSPLDLLDEYKEERVER